MIATDTNVLVRIVTNDDSHQTSLALNLLLRQDRVFIPKTVFLELEWVLRTAYRLSAAAILRAMRGFMDIATWDFEDDTAVRNALDWYEQGVDFADALHMASTGRECPLATFDAALLRKASQLGLRAVAVG
jgi:predicted nucleic-acid-binding protein